MNKNAYEIGTEIVDGKAIGRDPRKMEISELHAMGHEDIPLGKAIRKHCLECAGSVQSKVRTCTNAACSLWAYRMNENPFRTKKLSPEQLQATVKRLEKTRK